MHFINLTPHTVVYRHPDGTETAVPPSGKLARVETREETAWANERWRAVRRELGDVILPVEDAEMVGVMQAPYLIVSSLVLEAARLQGHRFLKDLVVPDTGPTAIREGGQIRAVTRWVVA